MYSNIISTHRDMLAVCVLALFCLMSVSNAAPLACEASVRPLDQVDARHLEGRWPLIAGGFSDPANMEFFKRRNSSNINFSIASAASSILYTPSTDAGGKCRTGTYNVSLVDSVLTFDVRHGVNFTLTFLYTSCPDCLVIRFDDQAKKLHRLLLFSRRREVEQEEMEEFKAQVECLNMPPPAVMDPNKELCPEQRAGDAAAAAARTED